MYWYFSKSGPVWKSMRWFLLRLKGRAKGRRCRLLLRLRRWRRRFPHLPTHSQARGETCCHTSGAEPPPHTYLLYLVGWRPYVTNFYKACVWCAPVREVTSASNHKQRKTIIRTLCTSKLQKACGKTSLAILTSKHNSKFVRGCKKKIYAGLLDQVPGAYTTVSYYMQHTFFNLIKCHRNLDRVMNHLRYALRSRCTNCTLVRAISIS